jgi:diguanylate cyclase (GGDEF)-like protein
MPPSAVPYPTPINEEQRLQAVRLHHVEGAPHEAAFDTLTRLAAHTLQAPVALIGLLEADRFDLLSCAGLQALSLPRQDAVCAHTIVQPGQTLVIEDLQQDARFAHSSLLAQAPQLRFYAGAAIVDPRGHALGTIAVMDTQPRQLQPEQRAALQDLAALAMLALSNQQRGFQLAHQAMHDPLTGLCNRRHFRQMLDVEMAHAMRTGEPFTVLCMDLDGFKAVNEGFGHAAGEEVLCEVARRLREQVRLGDLLARFSGDEFGVLMRHGATDSAQVLAKRIVKSVSAPITLSSGDTIGVGISIGMAEYADDVESVATLLAHADQALYQAKKQNEKRWEMFVGIR